MTTRALALSSTLAEVRGHYNFVRTHRSIRVTPAMEAGVTDKLWSMGDLIEAASE